MIQITPTTIRTRRILPRIDAVKTYQNVAAKAHENIIHNSEAFSTSMACAIIFGSKF
jgi:hypothetical protein